MYVGCLTCSGLSQDPQSNATTIILPPVVAGIDVFIGTWQNTPSSILTLKNVHRDYKLGSPPIRMVTDNNTAIQPNGAKMGTYVWPWHELVYSMELGSLLA